MATNCSMFEQSLTVSGLGSPVLSHNINYGLLLKATRAAKAERDWARERETNKIKFEMKIKINRKRKKALEREWQKHTYISIYHTAYTIYQISYAVYCIWYMAYHLCRHSPVSCLFACIYLFIVYAYLKRSSSSPARIWAWVGPVLLLGLLPGLGLVRVLYCV